MKTHRKNHWVKDVLAGICLGTLLMMPGMGGADVTAVPEVQAVYGGRIRSISVIELSGATNQSRIFISTESANSIFYGDVDHSLTDPFSTNNFSFAVVPDFDANANRGIVNGISTHLDSGRLYVADDDAVVSCTTTSGSLVTNLTDSISGGPVNFSAVLVEGSVLLAIGAQSPGTNMLYFGALAADGTFTESGDSPLSVGFTAGANAAAMVIHPTNNCVYILDCDGTNGIKKSSSAYSVLSASTTFSTISLPTASTNWTASKQLGIGPDGRLFVGSSTTNKVVAYSFDDGNSWTVVDTGVSGVGGYNIETMGSASDYSVYYGTAASTNEGVDGSWASFPLGGTAETHPNDGQVAADLQGAGVLYMTTDQGIGASTNAGVDIFEIDQGVEAVQIQDFDMTADKDIAWAASKSGIRRATNCLTSPQWMANGMFPIGDGSPYYSIAVNRTDTNGLTAYAGNCRIYKTTDAGTNWTRLWNIEGNTNGFQDSGYFSAIEAQEDFVAAGYYDSSSTKGGVLISQDNGSNWAHVIINDGVDVNDILKEDTSSGYGVYVAVAYDSSTSTGGIFHIPSTMSAIHHELTDPVSIRDLAYDSSGGIYASGQDTNYALVVYYKAPTLSTWTSVTTNGLPESAPSPLNDRGPVITVGKDSSSNDVPIIAVGVQLYYLPYGGTSWSTSTNMIYPDGTQINVLYWDELLVGTDTGLYGQDIWLEADAEEGADGIVAADFDGDGKTDIAVYHEETGYWWILKSSDSSLSYQPFGAIGYEPQPADYDGDGKADIAVYHEETGYWWILKSSDSSLSYQQFGAIGYEPEPADYDGDGKADIAVYHEETGYWWILKSSDSSLAYQQFGAAGYEPEPVDYDGDGKADIAVYHEETGYWWILKSSDSSLTYQSFGATGYEPEPADYDGDGKADIAVYHEETGYWWILKSSDSSLSYQAFGAFGYGPVPGDYDGDGKADIAVYHEETGYWWILKSSDSSLSYQPFGAPGYTPVR